MMNARGPVPTADYGTGASTRWASICNLILGIILFISPWYSVMWSNARGSWNAWIFGVCIVVVALWALSTVAPAFVSWINIVLGIWVFISPWVLGFAWMNGEAWTAWIVGVLVFLLAVYVTAQSRTMTPRTV